MTSLAYRQLAEISKWRRTQPYNRRWEQSYWPGWWHFGPERNIEICWAPDRVPSRTIEIEWRERKYASPRRASFPVTSIVQAINVLVALEILPIQFFAIDGYAQIDIPDNNSSAECPYCRQTFYGLPDTDPIKKHVDYCPAREYYADEEE